MFLFFKMSCNNSPQYDKLSRNKREKGNEVTAVKSYGSSSLHRSGNENGQLYFDLTFWNAC